jgi:hypothetical protein
MTHNDPPQMTIIIRMEFKLVNFTAPRSRHHATCAQSVCIRRPASYGEAFFVPSSIQPRKHDLGSSEMLMSRHEQFHVILIDALARNCALEKAYCQGLHPVGVSVKPITVTRKKSIETEGTYR